MNLPGNRARRDCSLNLTMALTFTFHSCILTFFEDIQWAGENHLSFSSFLSSNSLIAGAAFRNLTVGFDPEQESLQRYRERPVARNLSWAVLWISFYFESHKFYLGSLDLHIFFKTRNLSTIFEAVSALKYRDILMHFVWRELIGFLNDLQINMKKYLKSR